MNNKAHLRPKDFDSNGDIIPMACKEEKGDLISRSELKKACAEVVKSSNNSDFIPCPTWNDAMEIIDNAPTIEPEVKKVPIASVTFDTEKLKELTDEIVERIKNGEIVLQDERPQNEYFDISKLRLMTVEECAGHTIDYAMGWKACIEWIKKGGAE